MASRSSADKLKPLPPDPDRHQHSAILLANVGLPTLAQAFTASFQEVQWVVLAYLLAITTLIVSVGRLGDITGHRRLLLAGIVLFTAASILWGVSQTLA